MHERTTDTPVGACVPVTPLACPLRAAVCTTTGSATHTVLPTWALSSSHATKFRQSYFSSLPQDSLGPGAPRLLVNYLNQSVNALDLIPPVLRQYMSSLVLDSSSIQIMDFDTESVLQEALKYLRAETSECMRLAQPAHMHEGRHHAWSLRSRSTR